MIGKVLLIFPSLVASQPKPNKCGLSPKNPEAEWTGWGGPIDTDNATIGEGGWNPEPYRHRRYLL